LGHRQWGIAGPLLFQISFRLKNQSITGRGLGLSSPFNCSIIMGIQSAFSTSVHLYICTSSAPVLRNSRRFDNYHKGIGFGAFPPQTTVNALVIAVQSHVAAVPTI